MKTATVSRLTLAQVAPMMRDALRTDPWEDQLLGVEVLAYLRFKRKRLTAGSLRKYRDALRDLVQHFADLELSDFEPPIGTQRLEEFMERRYGHLAARTYNCNLSPVKDFFKWQAAQGALHGDPAAGIERAKARDPHRETFSTNNVRAIVACQDDLRDRLVLRLMLMYGIRKGSVRACQFKHFDHVRKTVTVFAKGGTVRALPIPDPAFWHDLERLILDTGANPSDYVMPGRRGNRHGSRLLPDTQISNHALHDWWYRCLANAGIVAEGTTKGEKMHKARHTAGQQMLNATGNLKAVQKLLGHRSLITTADQYLDWDLDQLAVSLAQTLEAGE